jgi:hypothetical protein
MTGMVNATNYYFSNSGSDSSTTGNITGAAYGIKIGAGTTGTGNISIVAPIYIAANTQKSTTKYGFYLGTMSGATSNYELYIAGTADSYFAGDVGIGTNNPGAELHVVGEANITGISGDGVGKVVCIKSGGNLGTCSSVVNATGGCTCS